MTQIDNFPYLVKNDNSGITLPELIRSRFLEFKTQLTTTGAILFKSFDIDTPNKLQACVNAFPGGAINYSGGNSPRTNVHGQIYTSTEHPSQSMISLHNELSYAKQWPAYIFFCCAQPAEEGGHTIIANSRQILKDLPDEIKNTFKEKGVQYIRNLHGGFGAGPSWQDTFETSDQLVVEQHCKKNDILFEWGDKQKLKLIEKRPAIINHPELPVEVWFNQADQFHPSTNDPEVYEALMELYEDNLQSMPQYVCFNDGTDIPIEMLEEIRKVFDQNTVYFNWEKGDLLVLDNILSAHGRTPFKGERSILVSMIS